MISLLKLASSLSEKEQGLYRSGLEEFDRLKIRLAPGQFLIAGARPGVGKTTFLLFLFSKLWEANGVPQLFISFEESERQLYKKLAASISGTPVDQLSEKYEAVFAEHVDTLVTQHCFFELATPRWEVIRERVEEAAGEGIRIIFLDKLQSVYTDATHSNREQELGFITRELKRVAMELGLLLIVSSSLNRSVEYRPGKTPYLSDLRESGMIEENGDAILLLSRPEIYGIAEDEFLNNLKNVLEVKVAKNRNGLTGTMNFTFRGDVPSVSVFRGYENQEFLNRFNLLEGDSDTPF